LRARKRLAYTTPLKALSNQKYADFCRQFGPAEVGLLTGDIKVNPGAQVLVMTTEIHRNMFYTGTLPGLAHVVLDECHYMGDEGRTARQWLPAIYFIFSRAGCERAMDEFLVEGKPLLDRAQRHEVEQAIREAVEASAALESSALNQTIFQARAQGVVLHHAGILPSLKRLTEVLFERGLVRVV